MTWRLRAFLLRSFGRSGCAGYLSSKYCLTQITRHLLVTGTGLLDAVPCQKNIFTPWQRNEILLKQICNSPVRWQKSLKRLCPHLLVQEYILLGWFFHNLQKERHSDAISIKSVNVMATAMREMCQGVAVTWIRPGVYWLVLIVHTFIIKKKMKKLAIIKWTLYFTIYLLNSQQS
jgi:hypothetical protein